MLSSGLNRRSPTTDQGVQTSGGVVSNTGGQQRQSRGGGGSHRGGGGERRYQQTNTYVRYPQDMRGRPPMRGRFYKDENVIGYFKFNYNLVLHF